MYKNYFLFSGCKQYSEWKDSGKKNKFLRNCQGVKSSIQSKITGGGEQSSAS